MSFSRTVDNKLDIIWGRPGTKGTAWSSLDLEFAIDIHPRQRTPKLLSGRAQGRNAIASYETGTAAVLLAAG